MNARSLCLFVCLLGLAITAGSASATVTYTYTLSGSDGLTTSPSGAWAAATLTYSAWQLDDNYWRYEYTINAPSKAVSHVIVGTSRNLTADQLRNVRIDGDAVDPSEWLLGWQNAGPGNVNMPADLFGIKLPGSGVPQTFSFESLKVPAWVSAYAKDGKDDGVFQYLYTNGAWGTATDAAMPGDFVRTATDVFAPDEAHRGWVLGPDSRNAPEPASLALVGVAAGAGLLTRKRRAKRA